MEEQKLTIASPDNTFARSVSISGVYILIGEYGSNSAYVYKYNDRPIANFTYTPINPTYVDIIHFNDSSYDLDGYIINWSWNFGDGNTSYLQHPTHMYSTSGVYNVTLTITDNDSATDIIYKNVLVETPFVFNLDTGEEFSSIQSAIDDADTNDGDTIKVYPRTYRENVIINKELKIIGDPVLDAMGGFGFRIQANNTLIENFTIFNCSMGIYAYNNSFTLQNVTINNCTVYNCTEYGIRFDHVTHSWINDTTLDNTTKGIALDAYCNNNTVTGNHITNCTSYGIWVFASDNNNVIGNIALHNYMGIYVSHYSYNNTIAGNNACNNTYSGIQVAFLGSDNNDITGNNANSNNVMGILLEWCGSNTITGNNVSNNNYRGIYLYYSNNNIIYNNYFNNTNNADDNGNNIWNITKTLETNIIGGSYLGGNYWSDYSGVDIDGDGLGDTYLPYTNSGNIQNGGDYLPLVDIQKPEIFNVMDSPDPQEITGNLNISCEVTDNMAVNVVKVNITYPDSTMINVTMSGGSYYYNTTYTMLGTYQYYIWANDISGNTNTSAPYGFVIQDTILPEIRNVMDTPDPQETGGYVNISCDVIDVAVDEVCVNITYPDSTFQNHSMSGGSYYYNTTYIQLGSYSYFIWVNDTSGNANVSSLYNFYVCNGTFSTEITAGENTINATELDVQIIINASGGVTVGVGEYNINPYEDLPTGIKAVGNYIEINIDNESAVVWPIYIAIYYTQEDLNSTGLNENEILGMYYYDDDTGIWILYNNTGVNTINQNGYEGYVWAYAWPGQLSPKVIGGKPTPPKPVIPPILPEHNVLISFIGPHEWDETYWTISPDTLICFDIEVAKRAGIIGIYYSMNYSLDYGDWTSFGHTGCFNLVVGQHYLYYFGVDEYGTCSNVQNITIEVVSSLAPITTCTLNPSLPDRDNGWYRHDVTITLTATDDISGVDSTFYKLNNDIWREYSHSIMITEDGEHTLNFYSIDKAGNKEEEQSITIKIDKTNPTINFEQPTYGHLYIMGKEILPLRHTVIIGKAMIAATAYDETSGIGRVEFYVNDELKQTLTAEPFEWLWDETAIGTHTIKAVAYDMAGNMASGEQEVWIFNL